MKKIKLLNILLFLLLVSCNTADPVVDSDEDDITEDQSAKINKPYSGWKEGEIDIHQINTGMGESSFIILPDGTSLLIDVGDVAGEFMNPSRPNASKLSGEWVSRYVKSVNPNVEKVDYLMITHFHPDHVGDTDVAIDTTKNRSFNYVLSGAALSGEFLKFGKILDRGWPDYNYPQNIANLPDVNNYINFIKWKIESAGQKVEQFVVGSNSQIKLNYEVASYPLFKVQNLFGNGIVWSGTDTSTTDYIHKNSKNLLSTIDENTLSTGIMIHLGKFNFYTGGDIYGNILDENGANINMESVVAPICGEAEVCKANHHAFTYSMSPDFVKVLNSKIYILPYLNSKHLKTPVLSGIVSNPINGDKCLLVPSYLSNDQRISIMNNKFYNQIPKVTGHIIVKVHNGGDRFTLYILNDEDELRTVKAVFGPYLSK